MLDHPPFTFRVIDLKQFIYCPRILYYHTVLPQVRPITYKMSAGKQAHQTAQANEKRRSLKPYGIKDGERTFNLRLHSPTLRLSGELDMLIQTDGELIPVDYKNSKRESRHYRLQLLAYAMLLEETQQIPTSKPIQRGFLYLIPTRQATPVRFTPALKRRLNGILQQMRAIAEQQRMPLPVKQRGKCVDCEFRRFCNDVL